MKIVNRRETFLPKTMVNTLSTIVLVQIVFCGVWERNSKGHMCGRSLSLGVRFSGGRGNNVPPGMQRAGGFSQQVPEITDNPPCMSLFFRNEQAALQTIQPSSSSFASFCWAFPLTNPFSGPSGVPCPHPIWSFNQICPG